MSDGNAIQIRTFEGLDNSPAAALVIQGWLDIHDRGMGGGGWLDDIRNADRALVAYCANGRDMMPVGVLAWKLRPENYISVLISFVQPEFRGRGCYSAMWDVLVQTGRQLGATSIWSDTHVKNSAMRSIVARQGREEVYVQIKYDIPR